MEKQFAISKLGSDAFVEMELGAPVLVPDPDGDFTVTAFDANHCPGQSANSVLFPFSLIPSLVPHRGRF